MNGPPDLPSVVYRHQATLPRERWWHGSPSHDSVDQHRPTFFDTSWPSAVVVVACTRPLTGLGLDWDSLPYGWVERNLIIHERPVCSTLSDPNQGTGVCALKKLLTGATERVPLRRSEVGLSVVTKASMGSERGFSRHTHGQNASTSITARQSVADAQAAHQTQGRHELLSSEPPARMLARIELIAGSRVPCRRGCSPFSLPLGISQRAPTDGLLTGTTACRC